MGSQTDKTEYRQLRDTIYTFFYYSNKPVIISEINLQFKNYKKTNVQKVLDDLVTKEKIFFRTIGKSKVYCLSQEMSFEIDDNSYTDDIDKMQDQTVDDKLMRYLQWNYTNHVDELNKLKNENKELDLELTEFEGQLSIEELRRAIKGMKETIEEHSGEEKQEVVGYEEFNNKKKEHTAIKKELSKRTKIFKGIIEMVCDGCGIEKKDLLQNAGVEL
ncbi:PSMC3 interacting protein [Glugoides intestinalis]